MALFMAPKFVLFSETLGQSITIHLNNPRSSDYLKDGTKLEWSNAIGVENNVMLSLKIGAPTFEARCMLRSLEEPWLS